MDDTRAYEMLKKTTKFVQKDTKKNLSMTKIMRNTNSTGTL